ncbi:MAG: tetratricopeptide repeat-containing serine protease family protein [Cyanobacteria bacterium P01_A01_bin.17]
MSETTYLTREGNQFTMQMKLGQMFSVGLAGPVLMFAAPQVAAALSVTEVNAIAKSTTVQIDSQSPGSGVLIRRDGQTYTVLTAAHVVSTEDNYAVVTPSGQQYRLQVGTIRRYPNVDLATVQFVSAERHDVAHIAKSSRTTEGAASYVAGFPLRTQAITNSIYSFSTGNIIANAARPLKDGYALMYSNNTLPGMSGGPVLNENGQLIGIHGRADTTAQVQDESINPDIFIKTGFNLGIPIQTFMGLAPEVIGGAELPVPKTDTTIDDLLLQASNYNQQRRFRDAIATTAQILKLKVNSAAAYQIRGMAYGSLRDYPQALRAFDSALNFNPNLASAYYYRGLTYMRMGQNARAIADYDQALKLEASFPEALSDRGLTYYRIGDLQKALSDYNQALKLHPRFLHAYGGRGNVFFARKQYPEAIADFDQAIAIRPNDFRSYSNRGAVRVSSGDPKGAIQDFNKALSIEPNLAHVYKNRGVTRADLGDRAGAIIDLQRAASLYQREGDTVRYQRTLKVLKRLREAI